MRFFSQNISWVVLKQSFWVQTSTSDRTLQSHKTKPTCSVALVADQFWHWQARFYRDCQAKTEAVASKQAFFSNAKIKGFSRC